MDKAKKFKLLVMKAFYEDESRKLHKDIFGALIEDEIPEPQEAKQQETAQALPQGAPVLALGNTAPVAAAPVVEKVSVAHTTIPLNELSPKPEKKPKK